MICKRIVKKLNDWMVFFDNLPLWWIGILIFIISFLPYMILREGSVFEIIDQLDETIMAYILNAKYLGTDVEIFPEMLNGLNKTGIQPSAVLFIPIYRIFSPWIALMIQYAVVFFSGYYGMYFSLKKITESSILATVSAVCFCLLPVQPIYGLSVLGVPLLLYAFLCLYEKKKMILGYSLIIFFGLTTHLILIGYVVLGIWGVYLLYTIFKKKLNLHILSGAVLLGGVYVVVNHSLFIELIFGGGTYISHRTENVSTSMEFWDTVKEIFWYGGQHAYSWHGELIVPICFLLVVGALFIKNKTEKEKNIYKAAVAILIGLCLIAVFYGICKSEIVTEWKNSMEGFFRYFQMERFYFLYPAGWYILFALTMRVWWGNLKQESITVSEKKELFVFRIVKMPICKLLLLIILIIPTMYTILDKSNFYNNVRKMKYGAEVTESISWESYYAEDLFSQIDTAIGRDMTTYRIANLGISPAPALMYGFYTVDGYSNNYSVEYKHTFREVIEKELEKDESSRKYFDYWGSRCYLFNAQSSTQFMISKRNNFKYEDLEFDMETLYDLGCEYLFSAGEIIDYDEMNLEFLGYFETDTSYWGIWVYQLVGDAKVVEQTYE